MHRQIYDMRDGTTIVSHGTMRNGHQFPETATFLPLTVGEVFAFLANAENLERITLPELAFQILMSTPVVIREETIIDCRLRLSGVPFHCARGLFNGNRTISLSTNRFAGRTAAGGICVRSPSVKTVRG